MGRVSEIEEILRKSGLADCCVLNPYKGVNEVKDKRKDTWGAFGNRKNMTNRVNSNVLKTLREYHRVGDDLAKSAKSGWAGVCQNFACASSSLIRACGSIGSIELCSFGNKFSGHVFLVLDRDLATKVNQVANWGPRVIVVDVWYANQRTSASSFGVYKLSSQEKACVDYKEWLQAKQAFKVILKTK